MTYDDWKTTDDTPEPERREVCPKCGEECLCDRCHATVRCICAEGKA